MQTGFTCMTTKSFFLDFKWPKRAGESRPNHRFCWTKRIGEEHSRPAHPKVLWPKWRNGEENILSYVRLKRNIWRPRIGFFLGDFGWPWYPKFKHQVAPLAYWHRRAGTGAVCHNNCREHPLWKTWSDRGGSHPGNQRGQRLSFYHGSSAGVFRYFEDFFPRHGGLWYCYGTINVVWFVIASWSVVDTLWSLW